MDLSADRMFRYRPLWYWSCFLFAVALFCLLIAAVAAGVLANAARLARDLGGRPPQLACLLAVGWVLVILGMCLAGLFLFLWAQWLMLRRRGSVETTGAGITVSDWLGRTERLFWGSISELHVRTGLGRGWVRLDLFGEGRRLFVNYGIEDPEELLARILTHTGLDRVEKRPWGTCHTR
jgi:hypothetical protein